MRAACRCRINMRRSCVLIAFAPGGWMSMEEDLDGLLAVCLQHEIDHLEGVLFIDHLSRLKRDMVLKKLAKTRKERALRAA